MSLPPPPTDKWDPAQRVPTSDDRPWGWEDELEHRKRLEDRRGQTGKVFLCGLLNSAVQNLFWARFRGLASKGGHGVASGHVQLIYLDLELPENLARLKLPTGVNERLTELLDKQDSATGLTDPERREAEGLVDLVETLTYVGFKARAAA